MLIDTIESLLHLRQPPGEIIIVDQTPVHEAVTEQTLTELSRSGKIWWIQLERASIPHAMNRGLKESTRPIVLFLDDDIIPSENLVEAHLEAHLSPLQPEIVVGQVLQPGETAGANTVGEVRTGLRADLDFPFCSSSPMWVKNVMAGNLSVKKEFALRITGFDENFWGVAYRFETEFARRVTKHGGKIRFHPEASIRHLRAARGGTRSTGSHLTSADPKYGIGDYYFAFLHGDLMEAWMYSVSRVFREVRTRFHLTHPWWIPVKVVGEIRALWGGWKMAAAKKREAREERRENSEPGVWSGNKSHASAQHNVEHTGRGVDHE